MKIGCRAHDYGKHPAQELALILHNAGYQAAQVAVPRPLKASMIINISRRNSWKPFGVGLPRMM